MPLNDLESRILKNIRPNFNWPSFVNGRGEGVKCMLYEKPNQTDKPIMLLSSLYSNKQKYNMAVIYNDKQKCKEFCTNLIPYQNILLSL